MKLLLDTHALLWWWLDDRRLSSKARAKIGQSANVVFVSAVSALEIAIKVRLGKLPEANDLVDQFEEGLAQQGFKPLPVSMTHALKAGLLEGDHRDPFDRLLAAQAMIDDLTIITNDRALTAFGASALW